MHLAQFLRQLLKISDEFGVGVVVTNQVFFVPSIVLNSVSIRDGNPQFGIRNSPVFSKLSGIRIGNFSADSHKNPKHGNIQCRFLIFD